MSHIQDELKSKSVFAGLPSEEDLQLILDELIEHVISARSPLEMLIATREEIMLRRQAKDTLANVPAFLRLYAAIEESFLDLLKITGKEVPCPAPGHENELALMASPEILQEAAVTVAIQLFLTGLKVGRLLETKSTSIENLVEKEEKAKEIVKRFKEDAEKDDEGPKAVSPAQARNESPLDHFEGTTDRKATIRH